jgi:deoxyribonuclease-4
LERLRLIHANDLKSARGSNVDRHWHIGQGSIGEAGFAAMGRMAELEALPVILETPGPEDELDRRNLQKMKDLLRDGASPGEVSP